MGVLQFLHKTLLKFPPELSHAIAKQALITYQAALKKTEKETPLTIKRGEYSLSVKNRVGLAAGFDKNAEMFPALAAMGFGFLELGTVTPLSQAGNSKPRLWRVKPKALVNHMGFNSDGAYIFKSNIQRLKDKCPSPLWINIGKNRNTPNDEAHEDYLSLFDDLNDVADAFVVNLSSPNTPGLTTLQSSSFIGKIVEGAPAKPLFVKLSPDLENSELLDLCDWIKEEKKVWGVVLTNTSRKLAEKLTRHRYGGLSGAPLFDRALECVSVARSKLGEGKILVGVGGIDSVEKAETIRKAGADLIEIYTGFIYKGMPLVRELALIE